MDFIRSKRASTHQPLDSRRPAKRILTPAGQRLSVILDAKRSKPPSAAPKISVTTTSTYCNDPEHQHIGPVQPGQKSTRKHGMVSVLTGGRLGDTPRESSDESHNGSNLSVSVWSDTEAEKFGHIRQEQRRGIAAWGWKKIVVGLAIIAALVIALAVGLAVGLKKTGLNSSPTTTTDGSHPGGSGGSGGSSGATTTSAHIDASPASPTSTLTPSALPSNFPLGTFSLVTFLDTVITNCSADPNTWTCAPSTNYYIDPQKALTIFNWEITGSPGSYKISSKGQDSTFNTMFQNEDLALTDAGSTSERYAFRISRSKSVNVTGSLGNQKGDFSCDFGVTNLQGSLYTKMQRTYPANTIAVGNTGNPSWPFAVKIEQSVAGGDNIPSCKSSSGQQVSGLKAQDASTLCSCLYKNWTPPKIGA